MRITLLITLFISLSYFLTAQTAPTAADNTVNCFENASVVFAAAHFGYSDSDGDPFTQIRVTTVTGNGTLWIDTDSDGTVNGAEIALAAGNVVAIADINASLLKYIPLPDENGSPYTAWDFEVYDGTEYSMLSYTMTINVLTVNSEPYFSGGPNQVVLEDAGAQTVNDWATAIDAGAPDEGGQTITFWVSNNNNGLFSVQPAVNAAGDLSYTPVANASGVATVSIYLTDDGGTANGGDDTSPTVNFNITINPVNDAPVLTTNNPLNINEGGINQVVSDALLEVTDVDNTPAEIEYTITTVPASGTLYLSGLPLGLNDTYTQADINANALSYSHDGTEGTPDSYFFTVSDGAGGSIGVTKFIINLAAVNDAPIFTSLPVTTGAQLVLYTYNITTTDAEGNPLVISPVTIPVWLALVDNGDGTATLSGTPPGGTPINNPITISVSDGIAPAVTQSWNLQISSGDTADAGPDQEICTDYTNMAAVNPTPNTGQWSLISGAGIFTNPTLYNTEVTNIGQGINEYGWVVTVGVDLYSDEVLVTNNKVSAYAGKDTIVCNTSLANLNGNNYNAALESGFWRRIAGNAVITNPTLYNTSVTNLDYYCTPWTPDWWTNVASVNVFEWVIQRGTCESTDQVSVMNGLPETIDAGLDQTVCENVVNLDALDEASCADDHWWEQIPDVGNYIDPLTGAFIPDNDLNMPFNVHVDNIQDGMSLFIWHKRNNFFDSTGNPIQCELTDTVEITSLGLAEDVQAGPEDATCDVFYTLNATPPANVFNTGTDVVSGQWSLISGAGIFDDDTYYNTTVRNMAASDNIYRWIVTNQTIGCVISDDVYIQSARPSNASAGPDDTTCVDFAVLASDLPVRYTSAYWTVDWGAGTIIQNSCAGFTCDAEVFGLSYDLNGFVWHVENEYTGGFGGYTTGNPLVCNSTDTTNIWYRGVTAVAGPDIYECGDYTQLFANDQPGNTGVWSGTGIFDDSGTNTSTLFNDVVRGLTRGKNTFTWTSSNESCSDADQTIVWGLLPPVPFANVDQTECTSSVNLNANDVTDYWSNVDPVPPNPVLQEATASGYWTSTNPFVTFVNASNFNTTATVTSAQTEDAFIWHSVNNFTDHETGITRTCELTDTMLYYNNAVTATAGADVFECGIDLVSNSFNLNAIPVVAPLSGIWTQISGPASVIVSPTSSTTPVTNVFQDNDYIYQWTVSATHNAVTCSASDDVLVQVRIVSQSVVNPSTIEVCVNQASLIGNIPVTGTGTWSSASGSPGTIDNPSSNITFVNLVQNGVSQWQWTIDRDGCISNDIITVTNNTVTADADLALVNPNTVDVCVPEYNLNATDPGIFNLAAPFATGNWTANLGTTAFDNTSIFNTTARNLSSALTNILTWTVSKGSCIESSQLKINSNHFFIDADVNENPNLLETCDGDIILAGEQPGIGGTGIWTYVSGSGGNIVTPSQYNTQVTSIVPGGSSLFRWTVTRNGCVAWDEMTVTNNEVSANAGFDQITCSSYIENMPAADPGIGITGNWQIIFGGGIPADPTLYNTSVSGLAPNVNTFRWNVARGICTDSDEVNIINNEPADFILNGATETCDGNSTISVNTYPPDGLGIWTQTSGSGVIVDNTNINTAITGLEPGNNQYTWTVTNSTCAKAAFIDVINNQVIADAGISQFVCADSTNLAALNPLTNNTQQGDGTWTLLAGNGNFQTSTLYNTSVRNMDLGLNTFVWTLSLGSCSDNDIASVTNNAIVANAGPDQTLEPLDYDTYFEAELPNNCTGQWSILSGSANIDDETSATSYVSNMPTGTHTFTWTVLNNLTGCSDSDNVTINTFNTYSPDAGQDQIVCVDTAVMNAQIEPGASSHTWSIVSGSGVFDDIHDSNTTVRNINLGVNVYRWTVVFAGYSGYDDVMIYNDSIFASAGDDFVSCLNEHTMNAQQIFNPDSTWWTPIGIGGGTIAENTAWNTLVTNLAPGDSYFEWYVSNGNCESRDTVILHYNLPPIAQFETDPTEFCAPETVTITNTSTQYGGQSPPDEFQWVIGDVVMPNTFDINGAFDYLLTNTANWDSVYQMRLVAIDYETMCTDTFYSSVTAFAAPTVEFNVIPDEPLAVPFAVFTIQNQSDNDLVSYDWNFGNFDYRYDTEFIASFDYEYTMTGTFDISLTGTAGNLCDATHVETVVVLPYSSVEELSTNFNLYPNPTDGLITISSTTDLTDAVFELKNIAGQEVQYKLIEQTSHAYGIDLSNLAKGMYFLKINVNGETKMLRLVKK